MNLGKNDGLRAEEVVREPAALRARVLRLGDGRGSCASSSSDCHLRLSFHFIESVVLSTGDL